jgi:type III secretory pathway lipoprotein EscJ
VRLLGLLLLGCLSTLSAVARADLTHAPLTNALVPSHAELLERTARRLSERLGDQLRQVPHVKRAQVQVTLPDDSRRELDAPAERARVSIVVTRTGPLDEDVLSAFVREAAPELSEALVSVVQHEAPSSWVAPVVRAVGPFQVEKDSVLLLRIVLSCLLASNVLLASLLLLRGRG